jgi:lipopolysaccharide export system protein LptA
MRSPLRREAATLLAAALLAANALLASAPAVAADESAQEPEKTTITIKALDSMETFGAKGQERTVLTGGVEIVVDGTIIRAEHVELLGEEASIVVCRGAVRVIDEDENIEIASEHLLYDRERSVLRIQGSALLIDRDNEVVVKGGFMEYHQDAGVATVQIGVRILKPDLVSRSEFARYRRDENTVDLSGMPVVTYQGDEYRAMRIFIDLEQDSVRMEGEIRGTITVS